MTWLDLSLRRGRHLVFLLTSPDELCPVSQCFFGFISYPDTFNLLREEMTPTNHQLALMWHSICWLGLWVIMWTNRILVQDVLPFQQHDPATQDADSCCNLVNVCAEWHIHTMFELHRHVYADRHCAIQWNVKKRFIVYTPWKVKINIL